VGITTDLDRLGLLLWEAQRASRCPADDCWWLSGTTSSTQRLHGNYWMTRSESLGFTMYMWRFPKMGVAPKSSILLGFSWGFSSINDPVIGVPPWLWKPRMEKSLVQHRAPLEVCPLLFTGPAVWNEEKPRKPSVSQVTCSEYIYNTRTTKSICKKKTCQKSI
jgi:hypothetical protein